MINLTNWKTYSTYTDRFKQFLLMICFFIFLEIVVAAILAGFIPDSTYLSWYLDDSVQEVTDAFIKSERILTPSDATGWYNRPNTARGNWVIDSNGSRSNGLKSPEKKKRIRVVFLGDSLINGGTHVSNDETISSYLEGEEIETLNFGTMLYSIDQSYLLYTSRLHKYKPDVLVVGIASEADVGLDNHYIPFRSRNEVNMPFLKPRFSLVDNELKLIPVQIEPLLKNIPHNSTLLDFLKDNEGYYGNFTKYKFTGFLPFLNIFGKVYVKFKSLLNFYRDDTELLQIQHRIMQQFEKTAKKYNTKVIFLKFAHQNDLEGGLLKSLLPDKYERVGEKMKQWEFEIVDTKDVLLGSDLQTHEMFWDDRLHFQPAANKVIADALLPIIQKEQLAMLDPSQ